MNLWTYRRRFRIDGIEHRVDIATGLKTVESKVLRDGTTLARDFTDVMTPGGQRNHQLVFALQDGRAVEIEVGYISWVSIGIAVKVDGKLIHESHPGKTIRFPDVPQGDPEKLARQQAEQSAQWQRNKYSFFVDIGLGALFFAVFQGEREVRRELGIPDELQLLGAIALGWPADDARERAGRSAVRRRRGVAEIVHRGGW